MQPFGKTATLPMRPRPLVTTWCTAVLAAAAAVPGLDAQVRAGLRGGVSLAAAPAAEEGAFRWDARDFRLAVEDVEAGLHVGVFLQANLGERFALQPELLFHATRTDYRLIELLDEDTAESVRTERVSAVELPLLLGYRWGPLRLQAGPVGRARVAQTSELRGVAGYVDEPEGEDLRFGYQAGVGLDVWRFLLDVKYDGSFEREGAVVNIGGQRLALSERSSRTYVTLGWALFGGKS